MTNKKESSSGPQIEPDDATGVDEIAAQFRPAWETDEADTMTAPGPRPIERVTAPPKTDEDPTMRVAVLDEERTEVDRTMPAVATAVAPAAPGPTASPAAGPPQKPRGLAVLTGPSRTFDAQALAQSDPAEMALSPMRPRAITVPTGFDAKPNGTIEEDRTQKDIAATRGRPVRRADSELPQTEEFVAAKNKRPIRIVFGVMGGLVVLIGIGVIAKAAVSGGSAPQASAAHATSEPAADTPPAQTGAPAAPKPRTDIPPPPPEENVAAELPLAASTAAPLAASLPAKPMVPGRVATPASPAKPPTAPARPAAATPGHPPAVPQKPGKGGIVRDAPF